ncbi:YHS domain-containing (seleno)protein [Roseovarius sp. THAF27]|uniref:YHS domain-containing (seleno)protein n=1 Tax=Roseovarius sp. THAF27 TaxID=2587850 RepID=UPI00126849FF|nr:YHS domain-containing (seleno)protein [Roseovarius sp. THAF27]
MTALGAFIGSPAWAARKPYWSTRKTGLAADGADVVAYHGLGKNDRAIEGRNQIAVSYKGGTFRFANADTMAAFKANPERFVPQFGGYCALSVANNGSSTGDKDAWHIHQGRLYLNGSKQARSRWRRAINKNIRAAERNWPGVLGS